MPYERKKCQGIFRGFVMERKDKKNGLYQAITNGECRFIEYAERTNIPAVLIFEKEIIDALVKTDKMPLFNLDLINNCKT